MVTETPIADTGGTEEPASQSPEPEVEARPEMSEAHAPRAQPEVSAEPTPKKRGRPKKEPPPPPEPAPKKPRGRPKKPPPTPEASAPQAPEASAPQPFTLDSMSSAMLVAELVSRRRQHERQMKQDLYRSFVM